MNASTKEKMKEIVGRSNFTDAEEDRLCYSYDGTPIYNQMPEAVVFPESDEQISQVMKLANNENFNVISDR